MATKGVESKGDGEAVLALSSALRMCIGQREEEEMCLIIALHWFTLLQPSHFKAHSTYHWTLVARSATAFCRQCSSEVHSTLPPSTPIPYCCSLHSSCWHFDGVSGCNRQFAAAVMRLLRARVVVCGVPLCVCLCVCAPRTQPLEWIRCQRCQLSRLQHGLQANPITHNPYPISISFPFPLWLKRTFD